MIREACFMLENYGILSEINFWDSIAGPNSGRQFTDSKQQFELIFWQIFRLNLLSFLENAGKFISIANNLPESLEFHGNRKNFLGKSETNL